MDNQNFNQPIPENPQVQPVIPEPKPKKKLLIISGILGVIVIIAFASFLYLSNRGSQPKPTLIDAEQPVTIKSAVTTEFAEYKPYSVEITPIADSYNLPVNLGKIENKKKFSLDNKAEQKLTEQGFVAAPTNYDQIYDIYKDNTESARPNFVTTDSVLHTYHIFYE